MAVPTVVDDKLLWDSFKKGSESAFIDIYNTYFQILYDFGRQYSGDADLVKDCIQEVFITIRVKRTKLPEVNSDTMDWKHYPDLRNWPVVANLEKGE